jgi:hypothetical protein
MKFGDVLLDSVHFRQRAGEADLGAEAGDAEDIVDGAIGDVEGVAAGDRRVGIGLPVPETEVGSKDADELR